MGAIRVSTPLVVCRSAGTRSAPIFAQDSFFAPHRAQRRTTDRMLGPRNADECWHCCHLWRLRLAAADVERSLDGLQVRFDLFLLVVAELVLVPDKGLQ